MKLMATGLAFTVPPELEASEPPEARGLRRDQVRLLISWRGDDRLVHARFCDLPMHLRPGDLLVVNDSATIPAALTARRSNGDEIQLHLSTQLDGERWVVEPRQAQVQAGEVLLLPGEGRATLLEPYGDSRRLWIAQLELPMPLMRYLDRWGRPVAYRYVRGTWPIEAYQTIFAREPGSAEMPSAGRAFSGELVERLKQRGVRLASLTLHTGLSSLESHERPYPEQYDIPRQTAHAVNRTISAGGRVIAVGTTVVRALESAVDPQGKVAPGRAWTDLVVTPDRGVRVVDGLLTGFHEPEASHLAMLAAFTGEDRLAAVYRAALEAGYLWHEFGDLHLILP